jgi:hypothetical protein
MKIYLIVSIVLITVCCKPENKKDATTKGNPEVKKEVQSNEIAPTDKTELYSVTLLNEALKVQIPREFKIMDSEMLNLKYPVTAKRPTIVYTDSIGEINVAFNHTKDNISIADVPKVQESILNQFKQAPAITLISSDYRGINGKDFFIIKFYSPAVDAQIYNLMFGTELNGRLLMGTFNCTINHLEEWQPIADKIVNSLEVLN